MIAGIGVDIVDIRRIQAGLERFGERFAARVLTPRERAEWTRAARQAHFLARRFAAKEAAVKALGTGFRTGIGFHDIEIDHDPQGRPLLRYVGAAAARCREAGVHTAHLSLSDEREHALAFVVLEI